MEENVEKLTPDVPEERPKRGRKKKVQANIENEKLPKEKLNEVWLSVTEAAKIGGVQDKTIRRAIQASAVRYKIVKERYFINFVSLIAYLHTSKKLKNKLKEHGIGQYVAKWQ